MTRFAQGVTRYAKSLGLYCLVDKMKEEMLTRGMVIVYCKVKIKFEYVEQIG